MAKKRLTVNSHLVSLPVAFQIALWISIGVILAICLIDLSIWIFNMTVLESMMPLWVSMDLITAISLFLAAISYLLLQINITSKILRIIPGLAGALICAASLVTLYVLLYSGKSGLESKLTGVSILSVFLLPDNRMDYLLSVIFLLFGIILILMTFDNKLTSDIAHIIVIPLTLVSYYLFANYILGIYRFTGIGEVPVSLNTGIALLAMCVVVLLMRPRSWLLKVFTSGSLGGLIARRLIPAVMIIPVLIGWLGIRTQRYGLIDSEKGSVLVAVTYTICILILIWFLARTLTNIDRKRISSEEALHESEKHYRELAGNIPDLIFRYDRDLQILYRNLAAMRLSGLSLQESFDISVRETDPPSSPAEGWIKAVREVFKSGESRRLEQCVQSDGEKKVFDILIVPEHEENDNVNSILLIARDITSYKKTEDDLLYQLSMLGAVSDAIIGTDLSLNINFWNQAAERIYGWKKEEVIGRSSNEIVRSELSPEQRQSVFNEIMDGQSAYTELVQYTKDNRKLLVEGYTIPLRDKAGNITGVVAINSDVTEKKQAENVIRNSEQKLKYHLENSPLAVVEWDKDFMVLQWSDEAEKIFGHKKEEVIGARINDLGIIYEEDMPLMENTIERLTSGKELKVVSRNRNYNKNRDVIYCIWYNSVLLDKKGQMSSVMSLVENVTTLKRTEQELIESKETYKELITNARSIIVKVDTEGRFTFINEFGQSFFGYSEEELLGKSVIDTIVPRVESSGRDLVRMVDYIKEDPDRFSISINENIKKSGERVWVDWRNKALFDEYGNRTGHIATGVDITERKKAEEELEEVEDKLWTVLNATQESIYMFDKDGRITMSNSTGLERLHAASAKDVVGHYFSEFMPQATAAIRKSKLDEVFASGKPLEFEDGRGGKMYHHNFSPVYKNDEVTWVVTYSTDITERRRSEDKLRESEDRFRTIAESLPVLISINRINNSIILFANETYERAFGFRKGELTGKRIHEIFYNEQDRIDLSATLSDKGSVYNKEMKVKRADGTAFWIMTSIRRIMFMNEPSYLTASIDITETKKNQEELLRLNRTLNAHNKSSQLMMHSSSELDYLNDVCTIVTGDCGYKMVWIGYALNNKDKSVVPVAHAGFNEGYLEQLNITWSDTARGRGPTGTAIRTGKPSICLDMQTDKAFEPWRMEALKRGYASSLVLPLIADKKTIGAITIYSGEINVFLEKEIILLSDLANDLAYGISYFRLSEFEKTAVRALKESESQLKELNATKDKFFNIIAHDLKNPFTSLLGSSELLYSNVSKMTPENIKELTLILNDSAKGGYAILQNLLDWSRSQTGTIKYNPEKINLRELIDENILNIQLPAANKGIQLYSEAEEDLYVTADKNMINTLLRNLLSNAVKYTERNGRVVVGAVLDTENAIVSVQDSGIGISEEVIETLFRIDTKLSMPGTANEQGTGLGLKLCKEFIQKMGGRIWVNSTKGVGSEFNFSIPLRES